MPGAERRGRRALGPLIGGAVIAVLVLVFTRGWHDGRTTLDGNGVVLYLQIAVHYWRSMGHIPYWIPDLWAGTPVWALAPIFPVLVLLPFALWFGPEAGVRYFTVALQIVAGWGAMTLAASLWREEATATIKQARGWFWDVVRLPDVAAVVAGCLYALHPIVISHGTFFGHETTIAVLAATPWLVWALRRGLRGDGARWLVLAALAAAFAILNQAEHAYALVIICALVSVAQLVLAVRASPVARDAVRRVAGRAVAVVAIIGGLLAHWLVPLHDLTSAFVLSPPDVVTSSLTNGIGAQLGNEPGAFVTRSPGLAKVVTYNHPDLLKSGSFYLGWVWLAGAMVALVILARRPHRDRDATMSALLLAAAISVWMSTAATPLARSGLGIRHEWFTLAIIGSVGGLCAGVFIRRVALGRAAMWLGIGTIVVLFAAPYLTPFLILQRLIPLAGDLRIPRLYPLAALGLSLGAAYPLTLLSRIDLRAAAIGELRRVRILQVGALAAAVGLVAVSIVDIWPYRTFYRTQAPADASAYEAALAQVPPTGRLSTAQFGDPRTVVDLYASGHPLLTGWPHPIAQRNLWDLAVIPQEAAPTGYRDQAAGLGGATAIITEHDIVPPTPTTPAQADALAKQVSNPKIPAPNLALNGVEVDRIGGALPIVRAYAQAVVVPDSPVAAELAVGLVPNRVSVVLGGSPQAKTLAALAVGGGAQSDTCSPPPAPGQPVVTPEPSPIFGYKLIVACALQRWVGKYVNLAASYLGSGIGALFDAAPGLEGVSVWLVGPTTGVQLELRQAEPDGSLGPVILTSRPGPVDATGMATFRFPRPLAAGRYGFVLTCAGCKGDNQAHIVFTQGSPGDLIAANRLVTDFVTAFAPIYPPPPVAPGSTAKLTTVSTSPGRWDVKVDAPAPQLVVVAESDFPGWHARIDGRSAPVLAADVAFVGVVVPAGVHELTLRYTAPGVTEGDWVSGLTLLLCLAILFVPRRVWRDLRRELNARAPRIRDALQSAARAKTRGSGARDGPPPGTG